MKIIHSNKELGELPLKIEISFSKVFEMFQKYASDAYKEHPYHLSANKMVAEIEKYPELIKGFSDFSLIEKHKELIHILLDPLFPEILQSNEIKAASIPFSFETFKFTDRFKNIIENAGKDYEFKIRNFDTDLIYISACTFILNFHYGYNADLKRPFFFDIPDKKTGITKHYRVAFNADFSEVTSTKNAPKITNKDYHELIDNFENIEVWKEKFPPNSYIFKGFGIINLFDVTPDENISSIKSNLLRSNDENMLHDLRLNLSEFFNIKDLKLGFSWFDMTSDACSCKPDARKSESLVMTKEIKPSCNKDYFCDHIINQVFIEKKSIAISNVENYGKQSNQNPFYKSLKKNGIGSIILIPLENNRKEMALLEIASPKPYELNTLSQQKLNDLIPVFKAAVERSSEEHQNILEATIQEQYTSIHPSVKWRFYDAAENYQIALQENKNETPDIEDIIFEDVYPLYGQIDIKGSSLARNEAIKSDLTKQLELAIQIITQAQIKTQLPIYDELSFRIKQYLNHTKEGLKAGDEVSILSFLKSDIYPVFKHLKENHTDLGESIENYLSLLDSGLGVIYEQRKAYEDSVMYLNSKLANYIDKKQTEAQEMFPHYFERYKTDGVEYNMYIGNSIVKNRNFDKLYLYNLRLWQLQNLYELEQVAHQARKKMKHDLQVASLILVHSNSMAIKFRMDEKQFDVDGAYNVRYEIVKKRIDKSHIKGTNERITVPNKIAIIYSQEKDAIEYMKYINYLQSKGYFSEVEKLEVEDLQGISGLKALRVAVNYQKNFNEKTSLTIDELIQEFN